MTDRQTTRQTGQAGRNVQTDKQVDRHRHGGSQTKRKEISNVPVAKLLVLNR